MATQALDRKKFGEDIAFGVEQTLACWATDFIDPYVGAKIQEKLEPHVGGGDELKHAWIGEISGDLAAFFAFVGIQRYFPQVSISIKKAARVVLNPIYDRLGKKSIHEWAELHDVKPGSKEYNDKLEQWKDFEADSLAKSSIVATGSIGFNVGTQKLIGNPHKLLVITAAKIAGATITVVGMLGLRFLLPKSMQQVDEELGDRYFSPAVRWSQKLLGGEEKTKHSHEHDHHKTESNAPKIDATESPATSAKKVKFAENVSQSREAASTPKI